MDISIVEGWTGNLDFQLLADGVAYDLSGFTVTLSLFDTGAKAVNTTSDVSVIDATGGKVRYTPDSADLTSRMSPYAARFKVTNGSAVVFFPSGQAGVWTVRK